MRHSPILPIPAAVFALVHATFAQADPPEPLVLADGGRSSWHLVTPAEASPAERHAAAEFLALFLSVSGAGLPIVDDSGPPARDEIRIQARGAARPARGFVVEARAGVIELTGAGPRDVLHAIYWLFEEKLGCRWFTRDVARLPRRKRCVLEPFRAEVAPAFEYREVFWSEAFDAEWAVRQRLNGASHRLEERHGGAVSFHPFVHTFEQLVPPSVHFRDHPEWFPEIDGKRTGDHAQLCLTHPEVLRLAIERVRAWIAERPDATLYSVSQNDWQGNCRCARCREIDEREGSPSGSLLAFVNAVADAVAKEHPGKLIDTLAYQYTRKPPRTLIPRPNVRVRLCSIECCFAHPLATCPENRAFREDLEGWARITDRLYVWDYTTDFAHYLLPFPNLDVLAANARWYAGRGVRGLFEQGAYAPGGGAEMSELKAYVLAKALTDPLGSGADRAVEEFTDAVYGPAAPKVRAYLDLLHSGVRAKEVHARIYDGPGAPWLAGDFLDRAEKLFDEGAAILDGDPAAARRLAKARLPLDWLRLHRTPRDSEVRPRLRAAFLAACRDHGLTQIGEGRGLDTLP